MIEEKDVKEGQIVYYYWTIDSCIEKGVITDPKFFDIHRMNMYLRCVSNIRWTAYVDKEGNEIDKEHHIDYDRGISLGNLFLTAEEAYKAKDAELNRLHDHWNICTSTLRGLLEFPLINNLSGEDASWEARKFYQDRIEEYLKNNK